MRRNPLGVRELPTSLSVERAARSIGSKDKGKEVTGQEPGELGNIFRGSSGVPGCHLTREWNPQIAQICQIKRYKKRKQLFFLACKFVLGSF